MTADLPPLDGPRNGRPGAPYRIAVVCLGNICRSPMAEVVLHDRLRDAGLADEVEVVSAGTGGWHVGGPMDPRAAAVLTTRRYDATRHRAQQVTADWFDRFDLVLAMDTQNQRDISALAPSTTVRMFRDFDPARSRVGDRDMPDPYFGGDDGFDEVLTIIERTAEALVAALARTRQAEVDPAAREAGG